MRTMLIVVLLLIVVGLFFYRRRQGMQATTADQPRRLEQRSKSQYHAVSIRFPANACAAAKALAGERFLAAEAPPLPLPACDSSSCECRFVHHQDRRSGKDRRSPFASGGISGGTGRFDAERRAGKDRRADGQDNHV